MMFSSAAILTRRYRESPGDPVVRPGLKVDADRPPRQRIDSTRYIEPSPSILEVERANTSRSSLAARHESFYARVPSSIATVPLSYATQLEANSQAGIRVSRRGSWKSCGIKCSIRAQHRS